MNDGGFHTLDELALNRPLGVSVDLADNSAHRCEG
jgi:hypothetical protein